MRLQNTLLMRIFVPASALSSQKNTLNATSYLDRILVTPTSNSVICPLSAFKILFPADDALQ